MRPPIEEYANRHGYDLIEAEPVDDVPPFARGTQQPKDRGGQAL
jgi:hypothetical protein